MDTNSLNSHDCLIAITLCSNIELHTSYSWPLPVPLLLVTVAPARCLTGILTTICNMKHRRGVQYNKGRAEITIVCMDALPIPSHRSGHMDGSKAMSSVLDWAFLSINTLYDCAERYTKKEIELTHFDHLIVEINRHELYKRTALGRC